MSRRCPTTLSTSIWTISLLYCRLLFVPSYRVRSCLPGRARRIESGRKDKKIKSRLRLPLTLEPSYGTHDGNTLIHDHFADG